MILSFSRTSAHVARYAGGVADGFCADGKTAWAKVVEQPFRRVLVADLSMPGMDGPELLTKVMNRDPHTVRILLLNKAIGNRC
jgi:CheY-like chemotaxis protein